MTTRFELQAVEDELLSYIGELEQAGQPANVVDVMKSVAGRYASSLVRRAYWQLICDGELSTDAAGNIRRIEAKWDWRGKQG